MKRQANAATLVLIKKWEALRLESYLCPAGVWTVGWGSIKGVTQGMRITRDEAQRRFALDLEEAVRGLELVAPPWLNDNQFGALVSFVFNFGIGALVSSQLMLQLRKKNLAGVALEFARWKHAKIRGDGFVVLPGLVARRAEEVALFETPVDDPGVA